MFAVNLDENQIEDISNVRKVFERVSKTAAAFQITDKFLSAVELGFLKKTSPEFDTKSLKTGLNELKSSTDISDERLSQIEALMDAELELWCNGLESRNHYIETYHVRRFCDSYKRPINENVYEALVRFYYTLSHTASNQSKFDLVITRLFTEHVKGFRGLNIAQDLLPAKLDSLFEKWKVKKAAANDFDKYEANETFDTFVSEAESFTEFEPFIKSELLDRFRAFKFELSDRFYDSNIIASAIACNVVIGNSFQSLLVKANEQSAELTSNFDLPGAFLDTSPNSPDHVSDTLQEIKAISDEYETEEMTELWGLLELLCVNSDSESKTEDNEKTTDETVENSQESSLKEAFPSTYKRLAPLLKTLSEAHPDAVLLREYMQGSKSLAMLDVNDFIGESENDIEPLFRKVLSLILLSEEISETELAKQKELSPAVKEEIKSILRGSHVLLDNLEEITESVNEVTRKRLLVVSNKLLETALRLKRNLVRISNSQSEDAEAQKEQQEIEEKAKAQKKSARKKLSRPKIKVGKRQANRWLIAATFIIAIVSGMIFFYDWQSSDPTDVTEGVEQLKPSTLPDGDHIQSAYMHNATLFVAAKDTWQTLSKKKQHKHLKDLMNINLEEKLNMVVIISGDGQTLGDISKDGARIMGKIVQVAKNQ